MNILFTNSKGLGYGGAEVTISQYMVELEKRGHNVMIASSQEFKNIKNIKIYFVEKWPYFLRDFYLRKKFINIIKKYSIDLISPQDNITNVPAILAAKKCLIPVLAHIRDHWYACPKSSCFRSNGSECKYCNWRSLMTCVPWYRYPIDLYKWINIKKSSKVIELADAKVVISSAVKHKLAELGVKNNVNIVAGARVLKHFEKKIDVDKFKHELGLRKIVVTYIGSFFKTKGILQIFKFMPDILRKNPDVSLLLVGDGTLYPEVVDLVKKEGLENQVVLTGRILFDKIPDYYIISDILIAPHLWSEPLGATILEASAAGKPAIISELGGTSDFKDSFDYIISPYDVKLWKEKILYLIKNPAVRKKLGMKAKKFVKDYSMEFHVDKVENIYSEIFGSRK